MSIDERRAHVRVAVPLKAELHAEGLKRPGTLRDLSKGGAFLS